MSVLTVLSLLLQFPHGVKVKRTDLSAAFRVGSRLSSSPFLQVPEPPYLDLVVEWKTGAQPLSPPAPKSPKEPRSCSSYSSRGRDRRRRQTRLLVRVARVCPCSERLAVAGRNFLVRQLSGAHHGTMDPSWLTERLGDVVTLQWMLAEDEIRLRVAYLLPEPLDDEEYWLGFGISQQGGMVGSDLAIYDTAEERLIDVHGTVYGYPTIDECGQDWRLIGHSRTEGDNETVASILHILEISRSLESNDINEDLPILDDESPTNVLAAWGRLNLGGSGDESDGRKKQKRRMGSPQYLDDLTSMLLPHGPSGRVSGPVRFFGRQQTRLNAQEDHPYIDLIPNLYSIPDSKTTYKNFCFQLEDFPELQQVLQEHEQVHIIGFQDVLGRGAELVHHMDLHGTENEKLGADKRLCRVYMGE